MKDLDTILTDEQLFIWNEYKKFRSLNIKKKSIEYLNKLIKNIQDITPNKSDEIGEYFIFNNLSVQFPFFEKIIFPALIKGAKNNRKGFYRTLACTHCYHNQYLINKTVYELNVPNVYFDMEYLLNKELEINPEDRLSIELLIQNKAQRLDFAIHELPKYLLLNDEIFYNNVIELEQLIIKNNFLNDKWEKRLKLLIAISCCWKDFIMNENLYLNFQTYLDKNLNDKTKVILDWNKCLIYDP